MLTHVHAGTIPRHSRTLPRGTRTLNTLLRPLLPSLHPLASTLLLLVRVCVCVCVCTCLPVCMCLHDLMRHAAVCMCMRMCAFIPFCLGLVFFSLSLLPSFFRCDWAGAHLGHDAGGARAQVRVPPPRRPHPRCVALCSDKMKRDEGARKSRGEGGDGMGITATKTNLTVDAMHTHTHATSHADLAWTEDSKRIVVCGESGERFAHAFLWDRSVAWQARSRRKGKERKGKGRKGKERREKALWGFVCEPVVNNNGGERVVPRSLFIHFSSPAHTRARTLPCPQWILCWRADWPHQGGQLHRRQNGENGWWQTKRRNHISLTHSSLTHPLTHGRMSLAPSSHPLLTHTHTRTHARTRTHTHTHTHHTTSLPVAPLPRCDGFGRRTRWVLCGPAV